MNKEQYLLSCLSEECGEAIKEIGKAHRFGLDDKWKEKLTPREALYNECIDVIAVITMLCIEDIIPNCFSDGPGVKTKIERVEKYMKYSEEKGTLQVKSNA